MRAVITVVGKDRTGIIAKISDTLYRHRVNIVDISRDVKEDVADHGHAGEYRSVYGGFHRAGRPARSGRRNAWQVKKIHTMHEDIFDAMHKI